MDMSLVADVVFDDDMPDDDEAARGNKVFDECLKIYNEAQVDSVSSSSAQQVRQFFYCNKSSVLNLTRVQSPVSDPFPLFFAGSREPIIVYSR